MVYCEYLSWQAFLSSVVECKVGVGKSMGRGWRGGERERNQDLVIEVGTTCHCSKIVKQRKVCQEARRFIIIV
eukprot:scaffold115_cov123-Cylindrotheca_fusiformis.AAC.4